MFFNAGTPLGDPIEVGALGQALSSKEGSSRAVALGSVKSTYGHTEGAAGLTGALLALTQISSWCQPGIKHLRGMNQYVQAAFQDWRKSHHAAASTQRQFGPAVDGLAAGTSSFGMSGINAHAILAPGGYVEVGNRHEVAWQRARCWPKPQSCALLLSVKVTPDVAHFACNLQAPRLAYLSDFQVNIKCAQLRRFKPPCCSEFSVVI